MESKSDMKANQMNGLYPIIRRVRRPLVPVATGAAGGADAHPMKNADRPSPEGHGRQGAERGVEKGQREEKDSDGKAARQQAGK